ncbi:DUF2637 domain-containing protein [Streptomyces sp. M10(2022)]
MTVVMVVIAALAFVFSFGNVWSLALRLGIPEPIAPLIAPMVDLSVVGLLVALRYLSLRGVAPEQMKAATRLMHFSGLLTLALNVAEPIAVGHYGRAAVDAVALCSSSAGARSALSSSGPSTPSRLPTRHPRRSLPRPRRWSRLPGNRPRAGHAGTGAQSDSCPARTGIRRTRDACRKGP